MAVTLPISLTLEGEQIRYIDIPYFIYRVISGATPETVKKAFEIIVRDHKVKSIFINIFGGVCGIWARLIHHADSCIPGIMRCDYIAEGVIKAARELDLTVPLIVRLKGTKEAEAKAYVRDFLS